MSMKSQMTKSPDDTELIKIAKAMADGADISINNGKLQR